MEKINAVITGVGGYVPDYILTNDEISKMVDTNDEWIMTRIGIKERHILNEEGLGTSYMARKAAKQLMQRTGANPDDIDLVIVATTTPDYHFPSTASILCDKLRLKNAFAFDMQAACSGFWKRVRTSSVQAVTRRSLLLALIRCRPLQIIRIVPPALSLAMVLRPLCWSLRRKRWAFWIPFCALMAKGCLSCT